MRWLSCAVWGGLAILAGAPLAAAEYVRPRLPVVNTETPPTLDGVLDDACWQAASRVDEFWYSRLNRPGKQRTEAWVCVDGDYLYVAFYCRDTNPELIYTQQTQRGGGMQRDDHVSVSIDPALREDDIYSFQCNSAGIQDDDIPNSGSGNLVWRGDWRAGARKVDDGYCAEFAIPFQIMVYPRGQQEIAIALGRSVERDEEGYVWPPMIDRWESRFMAVLGPLDLPERRIRPTVLPYGIVRAGEDDTTFQSGLDIKHQFENGMTGLFTLNPDFRNVEDIVETIAFTDTERFLDDTRPFFGEGNEYIGGLNTRRIPDVTLGLKGFGRLGDHSLGALGTLSEEGRLDGAFRYRYHFNSYVSASAGLVHTDRDSDPTNTVANLGYGGWHPIGQHGLWYNAGFSHSMTNGPGGEGNAWNVGAGWGGEEGWDADASYSLTNPEYRALNGFVPEPDNRGYNLGVGWSERTDDAEIERVRVGFDHGQRHKRDDSLLSMYYSLRGSLRWRNGLGFSMGASSQNRPPNRDRTGSVGFEWGQNSLYNNGEFDINFGDRGGSEYLFCSLTQGWAPTDRIRLSWRFEYTQQDSFTPGEESRNRTLNVWTGTYEFSDVSSASARVIERDGDVNLFVAYRLQPRNGRTLTFMFGDPNSRQTTSQFQAKMIWPL